MNHPWRKVLLVFFMITSFSLLFVLNSCVHDPFTVEPVITEVGSTMPITPTPVITICSADTVYFEQTVLPLVTSLCGKSGCHGTLNHKEFQMIYASIAQSYSAIKSRFVTSGSTSSSRLTSAINEMGGKNVSGYVAPTTAQINTLKNWISQGAKSNSCVGCDTTKFTYSAIINPILTTYCVGCHPSPGSTSTPNLSTLSAVQAEVNNFPGRLMGSIRHTAPYNTSSLSMPQGGAKLPDCYIKQIDNWIIAGMPNN